MEKEQIQPSQQKSEVALTIDQIRNKWNSMATAYSPFDSCMQNFYFTLIHMMRLEQAKHILEVACGAGKFIQLALNLKQKQCTYLASDLCQNMVNLAKQNLQSWVERFGVQQEYQGWLAKQNLSFAVKNGEEKFDTPYKFDRIICNLVLHITTNPELMLRNLNEVAEEGCLLGLSILANSDSHGLISVGDRIAKQWNLPKRNVRGFFHLQDKIAEIASKTGWEVLIQWEQNAPFGDFELSQALKVYAREINPYGEKVAEQSFRRIESTFKDKKALNFPTKLAILRKK